MIRKNLDVFRDLIPSPGAVSRSFITRTSTTAPTRNGNDRAPARNRFDYYGSWARGWRQPIVVEPGSQVHADNYRPTAEQILRRKSTKNPRCQRRRETIKWTQCVGSANSAKQYDDGSRSDFDDCMTNGTMAKKKNNNNNIMSTCSAFRRPISAFATLILFSFSGVPYHSCR